VTTLTPNLSRRYVTSGPLLRSNRDSVDAAVALRFSVLLVL
jgi:hypothetical protein